MRLPLIFAATTAIALAACSQEPAAGGEASASPSAEATASAAPAADAAVLDANTASEAELAALPGMTPALAKGVIEGRPYEGAAAFTAALENTVPAADVAALTERVFVPVNLNTATRDDIAAIPGMSEKMIHEFEEYRPYADMAEFDREIGKYVDAAELARLRRYVTL